MNQKVDAANVRAELETFLDGIDVREPIRPGEITVEDFAARRGIGYYSAQRALAKQIKAGTMTKRFATKGAVSCFAYSLVKK